MEHIKKDRKSSAQCKHWDQCWSGLQWQRVRTLKSHSTYFTT